ncbi:MAG: heme-binding protein, partial [Pseudonocardia sp.]|nr:heme-binding protein [Pseudonocardia sp.]
MTITLEQARIIVDAALAHGTEQGFNPLTVAVLDPGGALVALGRQDGSGFLRPDLATAKASGVLALGMTNRAIAARAADSPEFFTSVAALAGGRILSVPGGVFVHDSGGGLLGAVGVTGDASLNDEAAALAGIA